MHQAQVWKVLFMKTRLDVTSLLKLLVTRKLLDNATNSTPAAPVNPLDYVGITGKNSLVASGTRVLGTTDYAPGPGLEGVVHENTSGRDFASQTTSYKKAPGISGQVRENQSKNNATNSTPAAPVNPLDYVGISLVGKKFKAVNPDTYYVKKNEN
ncbi:hypothetical protein CTI12_AA402970 [Artemisia annua]|uniref:Uncharacterized protein n=1 Tax=Artemisia annua TaxID=35608 RepID=A0A2U1MA55_ARTAN|nr:hypothetical protein CTI12_AA402970 [Artemisia annua]